MKLGPSGWLITRGFRSDLASGRYAPAQLAASGGIGTTPWSSTRTTSIAFRSTTAITPSSGRAYGLSAGSDRTKASARTSRLPSSSGRSSPYVPADQASIMTRSGSVTPRFRIAARKSAERLIAASHSPNSSPMIDGWSPSAT